VLQEPIGVIGVRHGAARQASPASGPLITWPVAVRPLRYFIIWRDTRSRLNWRPLDFVSPLAQSAALQIFSYPQERRPITPSLLLMSTEQQTSRQVGLGPIVLQKDFGPRSEEHFFKLGLKREVQKFGFSDSNIACFGDPADADDFATQSAKHRHWR
jgi:hypothetical protein